jgi:Flp pilus assembly pilin Flp
MLKLYSWLASASRREEGQTMAEYGVILAVISAVIVGLLLALSGKIATVLDRVVNAIN